MRSATDGAPSFVFVPGLAAAGDELVFDGDEAHYLRRVVRVRAGESVTASDGDGTLADLVMLEAGPVVRAEVRATRRVESARRLEVWCGAPEGDRADWLVEKLGELGVERLRLVDCERGRWEKAVQKADRWDRLALAAMRQSQSAFRMRVDPPAPLAALLAAGRDFQDGYLADPGGVSFLVCPEALRGPAAAAVGPSGGFSDAERKLLADSAFMPTRLTASRLRTETAAVALAALVLSA